MFSRNSVFYTFFVLGLYFLLANAGGVPQAVTKAPGESNHNSCATCHSSAGNFNTNIVLEVLNRTNEPVTTYDPGEFYTVKVQVSGTNNPKAYGFQMSVQDSLTNNDLGVWSEFGEKVKQQNLTVLGKPRKYLAQSAPKTDGVFSAKWRAPNTNVGTIKFYFTGLAINLNGTTSGDNNAFDNLSLMASSISSSNNINDTDILIYPNPTRDILKIASVEKFEVRMVALTGQNFVLYPNENNEINIQHIPDGVYTIQLFSPNGQKHKSTRIVKI